MIRSMASDLPVHLLEEIFLHLADAADLVRASAACASFRRIVSDGRFLRRFRSLHPPVLGLLDNDLRNARFFHPAQWPRCSALGAGALAKAADFAFSFLADPSGWRVCDVGDRRVLLARQCSEFHNFKGLVIYDPLHRRHVEVPPIPGDLLAASIEEHRGRKKFEPFLAPATDEEHKNDQLSFRLLCNVRSNDKVATFIFSSVNEQWRCAVSFSNPNSNLVNFLSMRLRHYEHSSSCFYWTGIYYNGMVVLDMCEMKFSIVDLPPESFGKSKIGVGAGEGKLGLLVIDDDTFDLYSKAWRCNADAAVAEGWRHDKTIPMPSGYQWILVGAADGYALLRGLPRDQYPILHGAFPQKRAEAHYFIVDLNTLLVDRLCLLNSYSCPKFLYTSFPRFSPPSK